VEECAGQGFRTIGVVAGRWKEAKAVATTAITTNEPLKEKKEKKEKKTTKEKRGKKEKGNKKEKESGGDGVVTATSMTNDGAEAGRDELKMVRQVTVGAGALEMVSLSEASKVTAAAAPAMDRRMSIEEQRCVHSLITFAVTAGPTLLWPEVPVAWPVWRRIRPSSSLNSSACCR
jgi:ribosomal protein S25